jgi:hypothetical protein
MPPPDPEMRRAASAKAAPEIAQSEQQQNQTYSVPPDVQGFIAGLLPLWLPLISALDSLTWGAGR